MRKALPPSVEYDEYTVPIELGGTAGKNPTEALSNLRLVSVASKDQANGPVALDATGKVDAAKLPVIAGTNKVNVKGTFFVVVNESLQFQITDYDSFKNYNVTASAGTVSQSGDTISYTAPGTAQTVTLTVAGRAIQFNVQASQPNQPTITVPVSGSTNVSTSQQASASAFSAKGTADTHASSDWQLATDTNFATIVQQVVADTVNKTTWTPTMSVNTTYYLRVRYKGASGNYGPWSSPVSFTTRVTTAPTVEEAKLVATNKSTNALFGFGCCMTSDGTRVVVNPLNVSGWYVFTRSGSTWTQETFQSTPVWVSVISGNGTRVAIGTAGGNVTVYSRSGTTWTLEQTLTAGGQFGITVDLDETGTRLVGGSNTGAFVNVYIRSGTTWTLEQTLTDNTIAQFGCFACVSSNGDRVAVTGFNSTGAGTPKLDVFVRSGSTWTLEQQITPTTTSTTMDYFGASLGFDTNGVRLVSAAKYNTTATSLTNAGCVYVFVRNTGTNVWSQEAVLVADNAAASAFFGAGADINGNGDVISVGSCSSGSGNNCTLYVFGRVGSTWSVTNKIRPSDTVAGDTNQFALNYPYVIVSMARNDTRVVYAAQYQDPGGTVDAGACYVMG
jgi:hypothetical protein